MKSTSENEFFTALLLLSSFLRFLLLLLWKIPILDFQFFSGLGMANGLADASLAFSFFISSHYVLAWAGLGWAGAGWGWLGLGLGLAES